MLDTKTGHQNSDQNPGRISQEFRGHLILEEFDSHLNCWILRLATKILIEILEEFHGHLILEKSLENFIRILTLEEFDSQEFCGHLILEEFYSHLNCWILRLATKILIEILEEFHGHLILEKKYFLERINSSDQNP